MTDHRLQDVPVLLVEDDPANARMLKALCQSEGADVRVVASAREALATLEQFSARIAVVDLILPEMSGLLLVQEMKGRERTKDIVVIATSVVNGSDVERLAMKIGCVAFVPKPFDNEELITMMASLLRGAA